MEQRPQGPLDQVREAIRLKRYSVRTEQAHVTWIDQREHSAEEGQELDRPGHGPRER